MKNPLEAMQRSPEAEAPGAQESSEKYSMVPLTSVEPFYNSTFLKLHVDGKLTLSEDRRGPVSIEDDALAEFADKYKGKNWPLFLQVALHPEIQKEWQPDSFNSINNEYPRVFVYRQFSEETPLLFKSQENHAGIPIDDLSVRSLPDTTENMFTRSRLTEGDIENRFFLKNIPKHRIVDLREFDMALKTLGPAITKLTTDPKALEAMLSKSQFDEAAVEKIKNLIQNDEVLQKQIALMIINDNSAIVLEPNYLIDIEAKKGSLKTENIGHTPIPENVLKAEGVFNQREIGDVQEYLKGLLNTYNLDGTFFTRLQEKELNKDFVAFVMNRNGFVYDDVFNAMYEKISSIPVDKLDENQKQLIKKVEELKQNAEAQFEKWKEDDEKVYAELGKEYTGGNLSYLRMEAFKEPLSELITELEKYTH